MKGYTGIAPPKERVFLLIPSGLSLTMVGALGRLFASVIPGGSFSGPIDYSTAASLLLPEGMTPAQAVGHVIAAAELLEETTPELDRLRAVLQSVGDHACARYFVDNCVDEFPDDNYAWCGPCVARKALRPQR